MVKVGENVFYQVLVNVVTDLTVKVLGKDEMDAGLQGQALIEAVMTHLQGEHNIPLPDGRIIDVNLEWYELGNKIETEEVEETA